MNERPSAILMTDDLIERMLTQRAGRATHADLAAAIVAEVNHTGQRRPGFGSNLADLFAPTTARGRFARLSLVVALTLLAVGLALVGAALLHRPGPFGLGLAAYTSNGDIFVMYADGSGRRQLTTTPALDFSPTFSPDGAKIAYLSQETPDPDGPSKTAPTSLFVMNVDGSGQRALVDGLFYIFSVAWSPDSAHVAYRHEVPGATAIGVVGIDGSAPVTMVSDGDEPQWAPDGRTLAYTSNGGIHLVAADGSADHLLIAGSSPLWSPDGSRLAYTTALCCGPIHDRWLINNDGSDAHAITRGTGDEIFGGWSGDGRWTLITRGLPDGSAEMTIADANGANDHVLSIPGATGASWSPDGTRLFVSTATTLLLVDPTGAAAPISLPIDANLGLTWQPLPYTFVVSAPPSMLASASPAAAPRRLAKGFSIPFSFDPSTFGSEDWDQSAISPHAFEMLPPPWSRDSEGLAAYADARLYADPCHPSHGFVDAGSTPAALAGALATLPGFGIVDSQPVTLDGYTGVRVDVRTTTDATGCETPGELSLLRADPGVDEVFDLRSEGGAEGCCSLNPRRGANGGPATVRWLILDVHRNLVILEAWTAVFPDGSTVGSMSDLQHVIDSITFE